MKIKVTLRKDDIVKLEKENELNNLEALSNILGEYSKVTDLWINEQKDNNPLKKLKNK